MPSRFDKRLFVILSFSFIIATIVGTLSHEFGHYIVAETLGYKSTIHYAYTTFEDNETTDSIRAIDLQYQKQIEEGSSFPGKERYDQLVRKYSKNRLWIRMAGPLQTLLTGTIGLLLLLLWRRSFKAKQKLSAKQWTLVFITLFWLRQAANLTVWLCSFLVTKKFSLRGDEIGIALQLGIPFWSLATITGAIGIIVLSVVIFKFIPKTQRLTFVLSGMTGGVAGYILWLYLPGPVLLP